MECGFSRAWIRNEEVIFSGDKILKIELGKYSGAALQSKEPMHAKAEQTKKLLFSMLLRKMTKNRKLR